MYIGIISVEGWKVVIVSSLYGFSDTQSQINPPQKKNKTTDSNNRHVSTSVVEWNKLECGESEGKK